MERIALAFLASFIIVVAAACGRGGVDNYVASHWQTFPSGQDSQAVSWPQGEFKSCERSTRIESNYACYYRDDNGRRGFVCVTTNYGAERSSGVYSVLVAVGPDDDRQWFNDDGSVMAPKDLC